MNRLNCKYLAWVGVVAAAVLSGCATSNPDVVSRQQAQRSLPVQRATIESIRQVTIEGSQSGVGGTTGAVIGGIAGSSVGNRREGAVVGILGTVLGGVVGNAIEKASTNENAVEMILVLQDGRRVAVVQGDGSQGLKPGDAVNLIGYQGNYRVTKFLPQ